MPRVLPAEWRPVGIPGLEREAEVAVRSPVNTMVVAGPGAGKTETLAQRACYLLQTGLCPTPRRILAISMKRDAARNLQDRVALRCGSELSRRFDSMTFDAFAKSLVDRFRGALPEHARPKRDYRISFDIQKRMRQLLDCLTPAESGLTTVQLQGIADDPFYWQHFIGRPLPPTRTAPNSVEEAVLRRRRANFDPLATPEVDDGTDHLSRAGHNPRLHENLVVLTGNRSEQGHLHQS
jgi:DNA helicase-2/ATP-dependent DNA helicase PcrA